LVRRFAAGDSITPPVVSNDPRWNWVAINRQGVNDRNTGDRRETYRLALEAWRNNPLAKQFISIISDFIVT
jgi:hypothetical protein